MDTHKNAPLTPKGREAMVRGVIEGGLSKAAAARQFNTTAKTVTKWVGRFRAEGVDGLRDRSSRPLPSQTPPAKCAAVEALRRQRHTGKQIAAEVAVSPATVSRILRRLGLNRIRDLEPAEPVRRYEREHVGELKARQFRCAQATKHCARPKLPLAYGAQNRIVLDERQRGLPSLRMDCLIQRFSTHWIRGTILQSTPLPRFDSR